MTDSSATATAIYKNPRGKDNIIVSYQAYISSDDYKHSIDKELEADKIPQMIIEGSRMIGEGENPKADIVINYIRTIFDKLSVAVTGEKIEPLRIYLRDRASENAGVINKTKTPNLSVNLGLMESLFAYGYGER